MAKKLREEGTVAKTVFDADFFLKNEFLTSRGNGSWSFIWDNPCKISQPGKKRKVILQTSDANFKIKNKQTTNITKD